MNFYPQFIELKRELENLGHKITIPLPNEHYPKRTKLNAMHDFNKNLEKSEAILVANYEKQNKSNYIGINTIMEIGMAFNKGKKIFILFGVPENMKDELEAIKVLELNRDLKKIK